MHAVRYYFMLSFKPCLLSDHCTLFTVSLSTGGVVPHVASELHRQNLQRTLDLALEKSGVGGVEGMTAIAVTTGPGLAPCLKVGLELAKELARGAE